jgi:hypothetical protein
MQHRGAPILLPADVCDRRQTTLLLRSFLGEVLLFGEIREQRI